MGFFHRKERQSQSHVIGCNADFDPLQQRTHAYQTYKPTPVYGSQGPSNPPQEGGPSPWVSRWDPNSQRYYYVNCQTGERTWNTPDIAQVSPMTSAVAAPMATTSNAPTAYDQTNSMDSIGQNPGIGDVVGMGAGVVDSFSGLVDTTEGLVGDDDKDGDNSESDSDDGLWAKVKKLDTL
ncbi:hypothetical protein N7478_005628 [Penicillium angulare]|uniref:uncharacterized protein n=1 Tax=Penicillium angulare TaxID=116970 RepID=UPI00253FE201|nr:uncharacterized protein N7478_005628 [Penicillium angulare]KAJ5280256.1 hypothetical protein N7478_005628 [Penicillium angulare]